MKRNQKYLYEDCEYSSSILNPVTSNTTTDKHRNRNETRIANVYKGCGFSSIDFAKWNNVNAIIELIRIRKVFNTKLSCYNNSIEKCFYISTCSSGDAVSYNRIIRQHWSIENSNHYVRDVSLKEDSSRIRRNAFNMCVLRSFCLNILRFNHISNISNERYSNPLNIDKVLNYKGINEN